MLATTPLMATAGDWPTSLHDPQRTSASSDETTLSTSNAAQLTKLWSFQTGGTVASSPSIIGSTVYVGSWDGYEYALDAATGTQKWRTFLGTTTADPICFPPGAGVSSAAAIQNGVVYLGGGDAYWYALDANTGAVLWRVFTGDNSAASGHYNWSSPLIYNGYAYIGVASLGDCPLVQGQLLQVDLTTHQVVNTFNSVPTGQVGGGIWTSPSIDTATNTIFVTTGTINDPSQIYPQAMIALDAATLAVKSAWQLPQAQAGFDADWGTSATQFSDASGNPLVAATNKNGYTYAFNRSNIGAGPVWRQTIAYGGGDASSGDGSVSSAAFGNNRLYVAGGNTTIGGLGYPGGVRALDPATGNFLWEHGLPHWVIPAVAYADGLLFVGAGSTLDVLDATSGTSLYTYTTGGTIYGAPSISNGRVFFGSTDNSVYAFGLPSNPPPTPVPDPNCPAGWTCTDIGSPAPAGSETVASGTWNVTVGGSGIGGSSDQFRFVRQSVNGDSQISTRLVSQQGTPATGQAGVMVRQSDDPGAPYYAALLTPQHQLSVQYRSQFGGPTTVVAQVTASAPPLYVEIQRRGDQFQAATSSDGTNYTLVPGTTVTLLVPASVTAGVAVSSAASGTATAASFSNIVTGQPGTTPQPPATACPTGWSCADIGNPALTGGQSLSSGTWNVQGAGADIGGYTDQFHFVWQSLPADGTFSARVATQTNTNPAAKAGVMLRQSTDPGSQFYAVLVTPSDGITIEYRANEGIRSTTITSIAGAAPAYVEVARSGNTYSAYTSSDGSTWTFVTGTSVSLNTGGSVLAGMADSSHATSALSTATFDTVVLSTTAPPPPGNCPQAWSCADIGNPTPAGTQSLNGNTFTLQGGGDDIWSTADQFHFVWQSLAADGSVSARVASQSNTDVWAKAGVMLRQTSDSGSPYYAVYVTPSNGINVQYRASAGGTAASAGSAVAGTAPAYLQVARSGSTFTAYTSSDGATWTPIAGSSVSISMSGAVLAGLAVTSHNPVDLSTVTFDTVAIGASLP
ncbi:MAG: PQQ-binding-like beta-propeller repeat protein, partial [Chloroflexi bacterium]|nr:PQQ-binding-like beta-propeller repeat protein [Chloroflexota bacterium]